MASSININQNNNDITLQDNNRSISITDNNTGTTINVTQPVTNVVTVATLGPQGPQGPQGPIGPTPTSGSFTGSFSGSFTGSLQGTASYALTASYLEGYISPFPFTGSARITGSLGVTGSISTTTGFFHNQSLDSANRELYDSNGINSITWNSRALLNPSGGETLNWIDNDNITGIITIPISEQLDQKRIDDQLASQTLIANGKIVTDQTIEQDARIDGTIVYYNENDAEWLRLENSVIINSENPIDNILGIVIDQGRGSILLQGNITFQVESGNPSTGFPPILGTIRNGAPLYLTYSTGGYTDPVAFSTELPDGAVRSMGHILQSVTEGGLTNGIISFNPSNDYFRKISGISRIDQINGQDIYAAAAGTTTSAISASYALTASMLLGSITSASYATTASYILPLNQTLQLTGSLNISGSTTQIGNNNLLGQTNLSGSIIISGSVNASANLALGGTLRLDPAQDPGSTNLTASFLFTSASNTAQGYDLYYRQDGNLVKFKWLEGGISTGLLYGGLVSGSGTTIYVSSGSGIVMTSNASYSEEISPQFTYITWPNYSASATYLTSSQNTYLYVDVAGIVHQQPNYFTETQYQESICLGRVTHANYTNITGIGSNIQTTYDSDAQQSEFIRAFGPLKINGLTVTGQTGTLHINIGSGTSYNLGGFYRYNPDHPSNYSSTATVTGSMARAYRSGSGIYLDNNGGAFYTVIDPTKYDDGSGTLQNTGAGNWTIQRVFYNPESKRSTVYYGQSRYTSLLNALQYLATDPFEEGEFTAKSLIFVAYLVVKGNTTDLTNDTQNTIVQAGLFRNTTGGSGNAGTITLSLENLSDVLITTPVNNQALIYNSGTWINGYPASASFTTTASFAQTASFVQQAVSASFATTSSFIETKTVFNQPILGTGNIGFVSRSFSPSIGSNSTGETQLLQITIPANTFSASDKLAFFAFFSKTGTGSNTTHYIKISTSSSMPAGVTGRIAQYASTNNILFTKINRELVINGGFLKGYPFSPSAVTDAGVSTTAMSSASFDVTQTQYLYVSVVPTTTPTADVTRLEAFEIRNI